MPARLLNVDSIIPEEPRFVANYIRPSRIRRSMKRETIFRSRVVNFEIRRKSDHCFSVVQRLPLNFGSTANSPMHAVGFA